jgi:hypothetical protein
VRIILEGADKYNNLIGSLHYPNGDQAVDLSIELLKNVSSFTSRYSYQNFGFH